MDVSSIGIARDYMNAQTADLQGQVQTKLLRKVLNQEEQNAQQLLKCMPSANPSHMGNKIDLYA